MTALSTRRAARRRYRDVQDHAAAVNEDLFLAEDPGDRAGLLEAAADCEAELAALHTVTFGPDPIPGEGGRDLAEAFASSAGLLRLAARAERLVAAADWAAATDLRPGQAVGCEWGWTQVTAIEPSSCTGLLHVGVTDDGQGDDDGVLLCGPDDLVRVGGPGSDTAEIALAEAAMDAGAGEGEAVLWWRLATTAGRGDRADVITEICDLAAGRVGRQATEALAWVAGSELYLGGYYDQGPPLYRAATPSVPKAELVIAGVVTVVAGVVTIALIVAPVLFSHLLPREVRHVIDLTTTATAATALAVAVAAVAKSVGGLFRRVWP